MSRAFSPQGRRRGDDNEEKADDENGGMTKGCSRFALVLAKEPHDDERRGVAGHSAWHFSMPQSNSSAQPLSGVIIISVATRGGRGCSSVVPCDCDGGSRWLMATETRTGRFVGCVDRPGARFTCSRAAQLST